MTVEINEHRLGNLRWIVVTGPDLESFRALGEPAAAIPLADLAEGRPGAQRLLARA